MIPGSYRCRPAAYDSVISAAAATPPLACDLMAKNSKNGWQNRLAFLGGLRLSGGNPGGSRTGCNAWE